MSEHPYDELPGLRATARQPQEATEPGAAPNPPPGVAAEPNPPPGVAAAEGAQGPAAERPPGPAGP